MLRRFGWLAILGGGAVVLTVHALALRAIFHGNAFDDAYISFRYAENWARGLGLVFNAGERVEGYSNFLWVALLAPAARMGADVVLVAQVLGLVCSVGSLALAIVALRCVLGVHHPAAAALVALLLAASGYVAAWAVGGLEGPLFGLLLLGGWTALSARRAVIASACFAALALTRPEGIVIALGVAIVVGIRIFRRAEPRRLAWIPIVVVATIAVYEAWRFGYYGSHLLPNAVRAKVGVSGAQVLRGALYVAKQFLFPYALLLLPAVAPRTWRRFPPGARRALSAGMALWVGALLLVLVTGGDWSQGRFFAPLLPLGAVVAAGWGAHVVRRQPSFGGPRALMLGAGLAAYVAVVFAVTSLQREAAIRRRYAPVDAERIAIGKWLADHLPPDTMIAVHAAGQIPYYSRLRTHDMLGLNDPHIASLSVPRFGSGDPGHEKFDPGYTLGTVRPGIIVNAKLIPGMQRHALYRSSYYPLSGFWTFHDVVIRDTLARQLGLAPGALGQPKPPRSNP